MAAVDTTTSEFLLPLTKTFHQNTIDLLVVTPRFSFSSLGIYNNAIEMVKLQYNTTVTCTLSYTITLTSLHNFFELKIFLYIVHWV